MTKPKVIIDKNGWIRNTMKAPPKCNANIRQDGYFPYETQTGGPAAGWVGWDNGTITHFRIVE